MPQSAPLGDLHHDSRPTALHAAAPVHMTTPGSAARSLQEEASPPSASSPLDADQHDVTQRLFPTDEKKAIDMINVKPLLQRAAIADLDHATQTSPADQPDHRQSPSSPALPSSGHRGGGIAQRLFQDHQEPAIKTANPNKASAAAPAHAAFDYSATTKPAASLHLDEPDQPRVLASLEVNVHDATQRLSHERQEPAAKKIHPNKIKTSAAAPASAALDDPTTSSLAAHTRPDATPPSSTLVPEDDHVHDTAQRPQQLFQEHQPEAKDQTRTDAKADIKKGTAVNISYPGPDPGQNKNSLGRLYHMLKTSPPTQFLGELYRHLVPQTASPEQDEAPALPHLPDERLVRLCREGAVGPQRRLLLVGCTVAEVEGSLHLLPTPLFALFLDAGQPGDRAVAERAARDAAQLRSTGVPSADGGAPRLPWLQLRTVTPAAPEEWHHDHQLRRVQVTSSSSPSS